VITRVKGDLLAAEVHALVNTVNCVGVMGKGIALQVKRRYPGVFAAYERACKRGEVKIGQMFVVPTGQLDGPQLVINFPTKQHWRYPSRLEYIERGLLSLREVIRDHEISSVAIPPLGAGSGGLEWATVEPIIVRALEDLDDVDVKLYVPSAGPRPVVGKPNVRMTWGRAVLIDLLQSYVVRRAAVEPWEDQFGASHLEIQKLMYFANESEPRLELDFKPGRYGPYSERVRHLIQEMEGTFLQGHGDGTAAVLSLDPIGPTDHAREELANYRTTSPDEATEGRVVDEVLGQVEGFEGPYGLELLASTHWVVRHEDVVDNAPERVRGWTRRKGRIFTDAHVKAAIDHLRNVGAVP
jgi:O-acetyl-ADP-ribose deacetylase (regulator of RNase III)